MHLPLKKKTRKIFIRLVFDLISDLHTYYILKIFIRFIFVDEKYDHLASKCMLLIWILFFQIFWNVLRSFNIFNSL